MSDTESTHNIPKPKETVHQLKIKQSQELKALSKSCKGKALKEKEKEVQAIQEKQMKELQDAWNLFRLAEEGNLPVQTEEKVANDGSEFKLYDERQVVVSKAMKKRMAREAREQEQTDQVLAEFGTRPNMKSIEDVKLKALIQSIEFDGTLDGISGGKVKAIKGDGHCMFSALLDQLTLQAAAGGKVYDGNTVASLRQLASEYMKKNKDDFIPFLLEDDDEDLMSHDDMDEYCKRLLNMNTDILLGGHAELVALSHQLKCCIVVYLMNASPIVIGEEYKGKNGTLHVSYHKHFVSLGEHYNSVVPATGDDHQSEDDQE